MARLGIAVGAISLLVAGCVAGPVDTGEPTEEGTCPPDSCDQPLCEQAWIPEGVFPMGSDIPIFWPDLVDAGRVLAEQGNVLPEHEVALNAYCIDRYEVSWQRYWACIEAGACLDEGCPPSDPGSSTQPMWHGSPETAATYCAWIGRRVCTEAEWERAARGTEGRSYPWGEDDPDPSLAAVHLDALGTFRDVHAEPAGITPEGVYHLAGNALEVVADYYAPYDHSGEPRQNPTGPASGDRMVLRGGEGNHPTTYLGVERLHAPADWAPA